MKKENEIPTYGSKLRKNIVEVPKSIENCSGIRVFGQILKSFIFSTDIAIIRNTNADAIIAVYPFTPQPTIAQALISAADKPIFCGVGGGMTSGIRAAELALHAEFQGALGVVLNKPTTHELIKDLKQKIDIPVTITVVSERDDIKGRLEAGVDIFNVSGGEDTASIVKHIRNYSREVAIIATGGKNENTINEVIDAGANAVSYTPPTTGALFKEIMKRYRNE